MHNPIIKTLDHNTTNNTTKEAYTLDVDGEEYKYIDYIDPTTGAADTIVFDSNGQQVYDIGLINEMMMYITNGL